MTEANKNMKLLRPLLRGLPIIIGVVSLCVYAAQWSANHTIPMYESMVKIKLADPGDGPSSANLYKDFDVFSNKNKIGTEVEVLKSKTLVSKSLDSMNMETLTFRIGKVLKKELYLDAPFHTVINIKDPKWYDKPMLVEVKSDSSYTIYPPNTPATKGTFGKAILLPGADLLLTLNKELLAEKPNLALIDKYEVVVNSREKTINNIISYLDITSVDKEVPVLRIIYKSPVAEKAAAYVNVLSNTYIADYVENKYKAANITVSFLHNQIDNIGSKLSASEGAIEDYRNNSNIINIRQETETDLRKISQMKIQLANLQMSLVAIDSLNNYIQQGRDRFLQLAPNFEAFTDLLSTEMIKKIKELQAEKRDLLTRYTDNDEKVKVVDDKINDVTSYLQESINNTRKNYEIKFKEIDAAVKQAESVFVGLPTKEKTMNILERSFGLNEKSYMFLQEKKTEAEIARAATISFHRIIAAGEVPKKPVSPNRVLLIAVAAILGLLGSVLLIYTVHAMKAKVNDSSAIEKNSEVPLVAEVLMQRKAKDRSKHFNDLAIELGLRKVVSYPSAITISSCIEREGKSYIAANLALGITALGKRVLVVDVKGNVAEKMNWTLETKGQNLFTVKGQERLHYYVAAEETTDAVVIEESLQNKMNEWKKEYDAILLRNEPAQQSANALVYMAVADTNLFVFDSRRTPAKKIMEADMLREKFHIPEMKYILNRAHYNPSLWAEAVEAYQWFLTKLKRK